MMKTYLPDYCYVNHSLTGEVVKIEKGNIGYYETDCKTSAQEKNASINVTPKQAEAMKEAVCIGNLLK